MALFDFRNPVESRKVIDEQLAALKAAEKAKSSDAGSQAKAQVGGS